MNKIVSIYGIADRNKYKYPGFVHDHNLCTTENGKLTNYFHLERITRCKYDNSMPEHIEELLLDNTEIQVDPESVFLFVNSFVGSSFLSKNGRIRFDCKNNSSDLLELQKGHCWIQKKEWDGFEANAFSVSHEIVHAFSTVPFAGGLRENSLLISFDGGSSIGNFSAFHYKEGRLMQLEAHWELSHLSKLFNDNGLSFGIMNAAPGEHCSVPGKLMGFASWGNPRNDLIEWLTDNNYFRECWGDRHGFIEQARVCYQWAGTFENNKDPFLFDVAASMQEIFRTEILKKIKQLAEYTGAHYLYYAGGCALNIVTNAELVSGKWFRDVFISPCCNDSGLSIGAAAYYSFLQNSELTISNPYINNWETKEQYDVSNEDIKATASVLVNNEIVAVCNGNGEAGPRALGNRSLLARADNKDLSEFLSMKVKEREWYRPVAPIMLEKNACEFTEQKEIHHLSKYMLLDFKITERFHEELAGVVHANGTARIQTISSEKDNPFIFHLLSYLEEKHNIRALINTSFNGKGEPIVQTPADAMRSAKNMKLSNIVINGKFSIL